MEGNVRRRSDAGRAIALLPHHPCADSKAAVHVLAKWNRREGDLVATNFRPRPKPLERPRQCRCCGGAVTVQW
jgi:hypothetical protein